MQDTPFRPSAVSADSERQKPFAKLVFQDSSLDLYLNGGEVHATVTGSLSNWDLRYLEAMTRGLYPLYAGLMLESMHTEAVGDKAADIKLSRLAELVSIPVHHRRLSDS